MKNTDAAPGFVDVGRRMRQAVEYAQLFPLDNGPELNALARQVNSLMRKISLRVPPYDGASSNSAARAHTAFNAPPLLSPDPAQSAGTEQRSPMDAGQEEILALLCAASKALDRTYNQLRTQKEAIAERDGLLQQLNQIAAERDGLLQQLNQMSAEWYTTSKLFDQAAAQAADLAAIVASRDSEIHSLREQVASLRAEGYQIRDNSFLLNRGINQILAQIQEVRVPDGGTVVTGAHNNQGNSLELLRRIERANRELCSLSALPKVCDLLERYYKGEEDPNLQMLEQVFEGATHGRHPYWDIRIAARVMSAAIRPKTYLEVGTRRGWSLAQVLAETPAARVYVFDLFEESYSGFSQGGPDYLREKMKAVLGSQNPPEIEFIVGNSHDTLVDFFAGHIPLEYGPAPAEFDLITVDGDHTLMGAWWDLCDLFPHVAIGGALLFDDLDYEGDEAMGGAARSKFTRLPLPQGMSSLVDLWGYMQTLYPQFLFLTPQVSKCRAGIALRLR